MSKAAGHKEKATYFENQIQRANDQLTRAVRKLTEHLEAMMEDETDIEKGMQLLADIEDDMETTNLGELSPEDRRRISQLSEQDREIFESIDNARGKVQEMEERLEEVENLAHKVMKQFGPLSGKKTF